MGNPPFVGAKFMSEEQRADVSAVFGGIKNAGLLDFVAAWYVKAAQLLRNTAVRCAFVSTNSICQGEQVGVLWNWMLSQGCRIFFAHRTFQWNNEARGKAAVHCVIVGFACEEIAPKWLFEYEDIKGEAHRMAAENINPYLVNAPNVILQKQQRSLCGAPEMRKGSQPTDGGHLLLSAGECDQLIQREPDAAEWIRPFMGSEDFINNVARWCLWLKECPPDVLRKMPELVKRVEGVRTMRLASPKEATRLWADSPAVFTEDRQPESDYLLVPSVSSERRPYIPIGFMPADVIASNLCLIVPDADFYHFGVLASVMHNAWMRTVCGRLESRIRYTPSVYNNFPWPENPGGKQRQAVETAAQAVLDARAQFPDSSLADLYDPLTMPPALLKAHRVLDKAVDAAYGRRDFKTEAERVAFLFDLYQKYTASLLPLAAKEKKPGRRKKTAQGTEKAA
jgi:hypothetical protein